MARAVWRGTISFGMVSIPVKLYTATESQDITFRQLHVTDNSPIKLVKRCAADGKDLEADEIVKGYEYTKGQYVLIADEDLETLPLPSKQVIELSSFIPGGEIDPIYYEKSYFVEPEEIAKKPFALLSQVLADRNLVAIGRLAMRSRERLCALRPRDGGIQLETLYYADEVRSPEFELPETKSNEAELKVANALVDLLTEPFDASKYRDEYREALLTLIAARLEGKQLVASPEPEVAKPAVDLMAALRASVEAAKAKKEGKPRTSSRAPKAKVTAAEAEPADVKAAARRRKPAATKR